MKNPARFYRVIVLLALGLVSSNDVLAQMYSVGMLPTNRRKANFTMSVEVESVGGNGYHPVQLTFSPKAKTFVRDRYLSVNIRPMRTYGSELAISTQASIVVRQGSAGEKLVVYVPSYFSWDELAVTLLEDGKPIETGKSHFGLNNRAKDMGQHVAVGLIVGDGTSASWEQYPDVRTLNTVFGDGPLPDQPDQNRLPVLRAKSSIQQIQPAWVQYRMLEADALYNQWLAYSQLDVLIVAAPVLDRIRTNDPAGFDVIKAWVSAGGNLWIYATKSPRAGVSEDFLSKLTKVEIPDGQIVRKTENKIAFPSLHLLDLNDINDDSPLTHEYWNGPQKSSTNMSKSGFRTRREVYAELKKAKHPFADTMVWNKVKDKLGMYSLGLGQVITIDDDDPFPGSFQLWRTIRNLSRQQLRWEDRFGVDVPAGDENFWSWLIPSVGKPPVKSFVFLNILFALIVGPVCYFFLRKRQRLYLLYFAAPALAFLVTASLFTYAIASDGLSTKVRTRQITWLDPSNEVAIQQSRQTYYSVIGQSGGLKLSDQTAFFPVHYKAMDHYYGDGSNRQADHFVSEGAQRMGAGFLPPRQQVQYLTTTPVSSLQAITFDIQADSATLTNNTDYSLSQIIARDRDGKFWRANNVKPQASATLQVAAKEDLILMLGPNVLPSPAELFVPELQVQYPSNNLTPGRELTSLERQLQTWSRTGMPAGTFVGSATLDPDALGLDDGVVLDSVHFLMGEMQ
ncbi:MAG: hypothetical protein WBD20_00425 [Pirellulaceae bacterium]